MSRPELDIGLSDNKTEIVFDSDYYPLPEAEREFQAFRECPGCGNPIDFNRCPDCDYFH